MQKKFRHTLLNWGSLLVSMPPRLLLPASRGVSDIQAMLVSHLEEVLNRAILISVNSVGSVGGGFHHQRGS